MSGHVRRHNRAQLQRESQVVGRLGARLQHCIYRACNLSERGGWNSKRSGAIGGAHSSEPHRALASTNDRQSAPIHGGQRTGWSPSGNGKGVQRAQRKQCGSCSFPIGRVLQAMVIADVTQLRCAESTATQAMRKLQLPYPRPPPSMPTWRQPWPPRAGAWPTRRPEAAQAAQLAPGLQPRRGSARPWP